MSVTDITSLRDRLRADTGPSHETLDLTVAQLDFASREGVLAFLRIQATALGRLDGEALALPLLRMVADLRARALEDLAAAGENVRDRNVRYAFHPVACDYVMSGSRLGDRILRKKWAEHAAWTTVGTSFFTAPTYGELWEGFCTGSGRLPGHGSDADNIVADAIGLFELFRTVAEEVVTYAITEDGCQMNG